MSGAIYVDDTPLARVPADEWRARLAGAFQQIVTSNSISVLGVRPALGFASYLPARRAPRIDPLFALRTD